MIGSLGDIVFETSLQKIRTFNDLKRSGSSRWATHEVLGEKPKQEFIGPGTDKITFSMRFDVALGLDPKQELIKLRLMRNNGTEAYFVLNDRRVGSGKWCVKSLEESWSTIDNKGRILVAKADVTIEEVGDD